MPVLVTTHASCLNDVLRYIKIGVHKALFAVAGDSFYLVTVLHKAQIVAKIPKLCFRGGALKRLFSEWQLFPGPR